MPNSYCCLLTSLLCVLQYLQSLTPDDWRKVRPKHVECYSNKIYLRHWYIWLVLLHKFFFFFHWHYSPLWTLACRTMSFHFSLTTTTLFIFSLPALEDLFLLSLSIFSRVFPFFSSLPVLEWRSFWATYTSPFSLDDQLILFTVQIVHGNNCQ